MFARSADKEEFEEQEKQRQEAEWEEKARGGLESNLNLRRGKGSPSTPRMKAMIGKRAREMREEKEIQEHVQMEKFMKEQEDTMRRKQGSAEKRRFKKSCRDEGEELVFWH